MTLVFAYHFLPLVELNVERENSDGRRLRDVEKLELQMIHILIVKS